MAFQVRDGYLGDATPTTVCPRTFLHVCVEFVDWNWVSTSCMSLCLTGSEVSVELFGWNVFLMTPGADLHNAFCDM